MAHMFAPRPVYRVAASLMVAAAFGLTACSTGNDGDPTDEGPLVPSAAYGIWVPGPGECAQEIHDAYSTVGPDGKTYPTWHPPTDPATGCSFGHDHGRDPRGSHLYSAFKKIPFGYANEQLDIYDPTMMRHEDHVGHKVEWENGVKLNVRGAGSVLFEITCDVLTKLHQGTHSKDAFTNNLHELVYQVHCTDGTEMRVTLMSAIGKAGEFLRSCDTDVHVAAGTPTPANSPDGGGSRRIPDRFCVDQYMLVAGGMSSDVSRALHENWETSNVIQAADGHMLAFFNPYYQVRRPSRFYDPTQPNNTGRPIDVCYEVTPEGEQAQGGTCGASTTNGTVTGILFNDPRSLFNGSRRFVDVNSNVIQNAKGPEVWYTDPLGRHGRQEPFPGSVKQWFAKIDNERGLDANGAVIGDNRAYGDQGTHAPN